MRFELSPSGKQSVQSFYRKAYVIDNEDTLELESYSTIVASFDKELGTVEVDLGHSNTTDRHIIGFVSEVLRENIGTMAELRDFIKDNGDVIKEA